MGFVISIKFLYGDNIANEELLIIKYWYFITSLLYAPVVCFHCSKNGMKYLKNYHYIEWKELKKKIPTFSRNDFVGIDFVFSKDDFNDPNVKILKSDGKKAYALCLLVLISFPIVSIILE